MGSNDKLLDEVKRLRSLFFYDEVFIEAALLSSEWVQTLCDEMEKLCKISIEPSGYSAWLHLSEYRTRLPLTERTMLIGLASQLFKEAADLLPVLTEVKAMSWPFCETSEIDRLRLRYRVAASKFLISLEALHAALDELSAEEAKETVR